MTAASTVRLINLLGKPSSVTALYADGAESAFESPCNRAETIWISEITALIDLPTLGPELSMASRSMAMARASNSGGVKAATCGMLPVIADRRPVRRSTQVSA
ncbi:MAG: hypothetical protein ACYC8V_04030 [Caulobacteraceae bacterium]